MGACTGSGTPGAPPQTGGDQQPPPPPPPITQAPPPISGGTLLVLSDQKSAVVSDPDRDRVYVVDLVGHKRSAVITLETGAEPGRLVEDSDGRVHLALRSAGAVLTIDPRDGKTLARRSLCPAPRGLAFDGAAQLVHVACAGGELVSIAPLAEKPSRTLQLDRDLRDVLVQGNRLLVTTFRKAELLVVDASGVVERTRPEKTASVFATRGKFGPRTAPGLPGSPTTTTGEPDASPAIAYRLVAGPNQSVMMVHQRGMDSEVGTQPGGYGDGTTCTGIVESAVTSFGMGATTSVKSSAALASAVLPVDLAVSPDGQRLALVAAGHAGSERQLQFFSMSDVTDPPKPGNPCIDGGTVPPPGGGMTPPPTDPTAPIDYRPPNGEVIAVAFDNAGNILVQTREPSATLQILTQRVPAIVLADDSRADLGHQLFHAATKGQLACASCHAEGAEDARKWTFAGIGTRRTQSLRGGVMDTAPFHWSGDERNLEILMHDVFQGRMNGPAVDRERMAALSSWMDRIPGLKTAPKGNDDAAVARGQDLFRKPEVGCATCHNGADFTNGNSYDVGTGGAFQVPQLHSLAARAPYMHDGCAATLADRFGGKCGGDVRHGNTSQLTPAEIGDLIAYLESL
jgi:mono/diheme cytochrome c family protein